MDEYKKALARNSNGQDYMKFLGTHYARKMSNGTSWRVDYGCEEI